MPMKHFFRDLSQRILPCRLRIVARWKHVFLPSLATPRPSENDKPRNAATVAYRNCEQMGHLSKECPQRETCHVQFTPTSPYLSLFQNQETTARSSVAITTSVSEIFKVQILIYTDTLLVGYAKVCCKVPPTVYI